MSRASEWAERFAAAGQCRPDDYLAPPTNDSQRQVHGAVTDEGKVRLSVGTGSGVLAPDIFLALCRWGLATFGEEP